MLLLTMLSKTYLQEHSFSAMAILACRPFVLSSKEECDYKYNIIDTLR